MTVYQQILDDTYIPSVESGGRANVGDIAALSDGGYVLTWYNSGYYTDGIYRVRAQVYNSDGSERGETIDIASGDHTLHPVYPSVAAADNGGFAIVWEENIDYIEGYGGTTGIFGRTFDSQGVIQSPVFQVQTNTLGSQQLPQIAALEDGNYAVSWSTEVPNGQILHAQIFTNLGELSGAEIEVASSGQGYHLDSTVSSLTDGGFTIVWRSIFSGTPEEEANSGVRGRVFDADGSARGSDFLLYEASGPSQQKPVVEGLANGNFVAVWFDNNVANELFGQVFSSTGQVIGAVFSPFPGDTSSTSGAAASIVALPDGGFIASRTSAMNSEDSTSEVVARVFNNDGSARSDTFNLAQNPAGHEWGTELAVLNNGALTALWGGQQNDQFQILLHTLSGTANDDAISGTDGAEWLFGDGGNDLLSAGDEDDYLEGGVGDDTLEGGDGQDTAIFNSRTTDAVFSGSHNELTVATEEGVDLLSDIELFRFRGSDGREDDTYSFDDLEQWNWLFQAGDGGETLTGGSGHDTLIGGVGADALSGGLGNDEFHGGAGNDTIDGGTGLVSGSNERDVVVYDSGPSDFLISGDDTTQFIHNDGEVDQITNVEQFQFLHTFIWKSRLFTELGQLIVGTSGDDVLNGESQGDLMQGLAGDDMLFGGSGDNTLVGGRGNDFLGGAWGSQDTAVFDAASTDIHVTYDDLIDRIEITSVDGVDQLESVEIFEFTNATLTYNQILELVGTDQAGTTGNDALEGGAGPDTLAGGDGNDMLRGNAGDDSLQGGPGTDTLIGGDGNDTLLGGEGEGDLRDVIYGGADDDVIQGSHGNDELRGDAGDDSIAGGFGADTVIGGTGNDTLTGSVYADQMFGGAGDDFVNGGFGHDLLNGGSGADRFFHLGIFGHGSDWVQDYNAAEGDILQFGNAAATRSQFQVNTTHTATSAGERSGDDSVEEAFVIYRPTGQIMWALVDGGGQASINLQIGGEVFDLLT
ncbi:calcium-binding protein [Shimia thalassica]|uniref:calcium-binding protein n=1 Tax=Shimia thalassica TaxID=1715693 RepID=UPI0026E4039D|nr:calcium-binding protein [Shimia thalassica]MDO6479386.1 calcium-binding protein [Shimia thalassica]